MATGRRFLVGLAAGVVLLPWSAFAQLADDARISTQGTQFVQQPTPAPAPPTPAPAAAPPAPAAPAPPAPAPVQPPAAVQAPVPQPPPRFPSVVILLDVSDSMLAKSPGRSLSHLDEAKNAISTVIRGMSPETRVQVWTFSTRMT